MKSRCGWSKLRPLQRRADRSTAASQSIDDDLGRLQPDDIFKETLHWRKYGKEPAADLMKAFRELLLESGGARTP